MFIHALLGLFKGRGGN